MAELRVRVVLALGLLLVVGVFVLEMSRSAPRTAGSDHVATPVFAASVPGGGRLCQQVSPLPSDAATASLLIGTYGRPVPALGLRFTDARGATTASGSVPAGTHDDSVTIPLRHVSRSGSARVGAAGEPTTACLDVGGRSKVVVAGEGGPIGLGSEIVDGRPQGGRFSMVYTRGGSESWWQLLPTLTERFGLGKAAFFGTWTLPVMALLLLAVWVTAIRLLARDSGGASRGAA